MCVESAQYVKLYRLKNELSKKQVPKMWTAVGLQFSADEKSLIYKEQRAAVINRDNIVQHNIIDWNFDLDRSTSSKVPDSVSYQSWIPFFPGFGSQTRDLEFFSQSGERFLAAIVKRGRVAIFSEKNFESPLREIYITQNWLLDLSIHPNGRIAAVACQNGSVFIFDLNSGEVLTQFSLTQMFTQYFDEYPVTMNFDATGKHLFVTDLNRNLIKLSLEFDGEHTLISKGFASDAGVNMALSPDGESIAVVGFGSKLKIYDFDLNLKREFNLSPSSIAIGQSVNYSPDGSKVYAGVYEGTWSEIELKTGKQLRIRFSVSETSTTNLVISPSGDKLAFMGGGFVQVSDLNLDRVYKNICTWLRPRLPHIPDLSEVDRNLCNL